uniref:Uncharacterized protein n=1 Tax=Oryza glaberrima TaxID=4538 RepID=I1PCI2_ORYGL
MEVDLAPSWPSREGAAPAAPLRRSAEEIELPLEEAVAQAEEADEVMAAGLRSGGGEARPAVEEATLVRGGAAGGCGAVFGARRLASGGRRCRGPTYQQRLSGGGALVRQPWIRRW